MIHKCKHCYIYVQTNECAFPTLSPFVTIPAFICGFLTLSWRGLIYKCIFFKRTAYQMLQFQPITSQHKFKGIVECDHTALHLQICVTSRVTFICEFWNYSNSIIDTHSKSRHTPFASNCGIYLFSRFFIFHFKSLWNWHHSTTPMTWFVPFGNSSF